MLEYRCQLGHSSVLSSPNQPQTYVGIHLGDANSIRSGVLPVDTTVLTLETYLAHRIPRIGTNVLHTRHPVPCTEENCSESAALHSVRTFWPDILQITPSDTVAARYIDVKSAVHPQLDPHILINGVLVCYKLIACIRRINDDHFITLLRDGNTTMVYNGRVADGKMKYYGPPRLLDRTR